MTTKGIDIAIDVFQKIYNEFESITLGIVGEIMVLIHKNQ